MVNYSELKEAYHKIDNMSEEEIWLIFDEIFNKGISKKTASYKYGLIHSILMLNQKYPIQTRFNFDQVFRPFTEIYWKLININHLYQISKGTLSSVYKILNQYLLNNPSSRDLEFNLVDEREQQKLIENVAEKCSRNVFGALFGDSKELFYSFDIKEKFIDLNPQFRDFLLKYHALIRKINAYEWLKFLQMRNPDKRVDINVFENDINSEIPSTFEDFWKLVREKFDVSTTIFTLKQQKANKILEINDVGVLVETDRGVDTVKRDLIQKAWDNLVKDGVLYRDEHEKSTYRSSFIVTFFAQFDFIESNIKGKTSVKINY